MTKPPRKKPAKAGAKKVSPAVRQTPAKASAMVSAPRRPSSALASGGDRFAEVLALIEAARNRAYQAVNTELVRLYWQLGEYISQKLEKAEWGDGVVDELAATLARRLLAAIRGRWTKRELERQIQSAAILRSDPAAKKVSPAVAQIHPTAIDELKNAYSLEFLSMQDGHSEADLHGALRRNLGRFITELGRDFCFVGSEYPIQVGNQDFAIDLVFFHRALQCLVAFELKVDKFKPADLGQLSFYVEALDRDVKKAHERPSIGVLLCATKDDEVVEYALARTTSPTLVAEYQAMLPPKAVLRRKLHELYAQLSVDEPGDERGRRRRR